MSRIRTIKPGFFKNSDLYDGERETGLPLRVAYAGLWTAADREGRFKWKPRELKTDILPYDEVDFAAVLDALISAGFIVKYESGGHDYGFIPTFLEHQVINTREAKSALPEPHVNTTHVHACADTGTHVHAHGEGKGRSLREGVLGKGNGKEMEGKGGGGESREARETPHPPDGNCLKNSLGTRWPVEACIPADWVSQATELRKRHGLPEIDLALEAERFANHWAAKAEGETLKVDWRRAWLNWATSAVANQHAKPNGTGPPGDPVTERLLARYAREEAEEAAKHEQN